MSLQPAAAAAVDAQPYSLEVLNYSRTKGGPNVLVAAAVSAAVGTVVFAAVAAAAIAVVEDYLFEW